MKELIKIFCSSVNRPKEDTAVQEEIDPEIAPLCTAINSLKGCKTTSSCSQHYFSDEENSGPADFSNGGRQVYVSVVFEDIESMGIVIDAFFSSPYRWKVITTRRHGRDYDLESNQVRQIFQYMFDNKRGRDKEFSRIISYIKSRVV